MKGQKKIFRRYIIPIFTGNGYEVKRFDNNDLLLYKLNNYNNDVKINFYIHTFPNFYKKENINTNLLETNIKHKKFSEEVCFPIILEGKENICFENGRWISFDTEEEFIGLLEFQVKQFKEWIFDLLDEKKYNEIFDKYNTSRIEFIEKCNKLKEEYGNNWNNFIRDKSKEIESRRYKPIEWIMK